MLFKILGIGTRLFLQETETGKAIAKDLKKVATDLEASGKEVVNQIKLSASRKFAQQAFVDEDYEKTVSLCKEILKSDYQDISTLLLRGHAFTMLEEYDQAHSDFSKVIALSPEESDAFRGEAKIWHLKGNIDKAMGQINKAINLNPENTNALQLRAALHKDLNQKDEAIKDLDKAISLNPKNIEELKELRADMDGTSWISILGGLVIWVIIIAAIYLWLTK